MSETGNISFNVNSTFDGVGVYRIFSEPGCDLSDLILSGTTNIINGTANVNITELTLKENISIEFIDSKGCDICNDFEITISTTSTTTAEPTTTTTTSTTTLEPTTTTTSTTTLEPITTTTSTTTILPYSGDCRTYQLSADGDTTTVYEYYEYPSGDLKEVTLLLNESDTINAYENPGIVIKSGNGSFGDLGLCSESTTTAEPTTTSTTTLEPIV
jgi:hypothetical protein